MITATMSNPCLPSKTLLQTFLKSYTSLRCTTQVRSTSTYMPRHKYAAVTRLDKLHRTQKDALRQEKLLALQRADAISTTFTTSISPSQNDSISHPFRIERTPSSQLPVYESAKNGGNKHITTIRKLSGDLDKLAAQLRQVLNLPEYTVDRKGNKKASVAINRLNRHIVIKGWRGKEVQAWMTAVGL